MSKPAALVVLSLCAVSVGLAVSYAPRPEAHRAELPVRSSTPAVAPSPPAQEPTDLPPLALPVTRPIGLQPGGAVRMGPHTIPAGLTVTVTSAPSEPELVGISVRTAFDTAYCYSGRIASPFAVAAIDFTPHRNVTSGPNWVPVGTPLNLRVHLITPTWAMGDIVQTSAAPFTATGTIFRYLPGGVSLIGVVVSE